MKKLTFALLGICLTLSALAGGPGKDSDGTGTFKGRVFDSESAEALPGARIYIPALDLELFADLDGAFSFDGIPAGEYAVEISFISYRETTLKEISIPAEGQHSRTIFLDTL